METILLYAACMNIFCQKEAKKGEKDSYYCKHYGYHY